MIASASVAVYIILFLGAFSPMHCRCLVALAGAVSVVLSFFSGFGLLFLCGQSYSTFHSWLPFLLMAIGVEHMFVICGAVDQTDLNSSAYSRIHEALSHAGPAITVTTLATCLAFASGAVSSLEALRSFCTFATVCIAMLYFVNMTFFLAVVVWDTRRVQDRKKECFGLCCVRENSRLCCKGRCSSPKQREYSGNVQFAVADINSIRILEVSIEVSSARKAIMKNSLTERCCGILCAPVILSNVCRFFMLLVFVVLIAGASYATTMIEVYFDQRYFISDSSQIGDWFAANEKYFTNGGTPTITYVENSDIDFSSIESQNKMHSLNSALQECKGCEQPWHQNFSLESWYAEFANWVSIGDCSVVTPAVIPGQKIVVPSGQFYDCLTEWFTTDQGRN